MARFAGRGPGTRYHWSPRNAKNTKIRGGWRRAGLIFRSICWIPATIRQRRWSGGAPNLVSAERSGGAKRRSGAERTPDSELRSGGGAGVSSPGYSHIDRKINPERSQTPRIFELSFSARCKAEMPVELRPKCWIRRRNVAPDQRYAAQLNEMPARSTKCPPDQQNASVQISETLAFG